MMLDLLTLASGAPSAGLVTDMLVILGAAGLISVALKRLHLASIPGYLLMGALIGTLPSSWGLLSMENVGQIQEIAIILLLFIIGLHLDIDAIRSGMVPILIVGLASTVAIALVGWPVAMVFGLTPPAALTVAMALSMSSTAVLLGILQQRKEVHHTHGRLCVGISIVQDLLSIAVLAMLPALALWHAKVGPVVADAAHAAATAVSTAGAAESAMPAWQKLVFNGLVGFGGIVTMLAFAKWVLPRLLREASRGGNTEGLLVASAGAGLCAAVLTSYLGFGPALGAFLAGFMLSSTPFRYQLAGQLSPMRDLFMAVFFTAVGVKLDLVHLLGAWWVVLLALPLVIGIKAVITWTSVWIAGATATVALSTAALLAQAGEFSLVVLGEAERAGLVSPGQSATIIAIVVVSLIIATPQYDWFKKLSPRMANIRPAAWFASSSLREQQAVTGHEAHGAHAGGHGPGHANGAGHASGNGQEQPAEAGRMSHVIVAGFGVVGRNLAEHFAARGIPFTVVELNPGTVTRQQRLGRPTVFGDIATPDVLESAGLATASAVVITIPDDEATLRACKAIRTLRPDVFIAARTSYLSRAIAAHELGADHVTIEEVVTAQDMAVKVMHELDKRYPAKAPTPHL